MNKAAALIIALSLLLCGCGTEQPEAETDDTKLQIVCSCFPAYDFAREIAGDRAQITLLLKPGAEVHSYEPSPKDIIRIQESDLFICNGGESEEWVESLTDDNANVICMMDCVDTVEESDEGIYSADRDEHEHEHDETELDEHVWTSPLNAVKIVEQIADKLCAVDKSGSRDYLVNCEMYKTKLLELDIRFRTTVLQAERTTLVFADRFPMLYFCREFGLDYRAAFHGCSGDTEPSLATIKYLIDKVEDEDIPVVYTIDFGTKKVAAVVSECTGAAVDTLYSMQTVSRADFDAGETYLTLMERNYEALRKGLNE